MKEPAVSPYCGTDEGVPRVVFYCRTLQRSCWQGLASPSAGSSLCWGPLSWDLCWSLDLDCPRQDSGLCWGRCRQLALSTPSYCFEQGLLGCCGAFWARCETKATAFPEGFRGTHPDEGMSALAAWPNSSRNNVTRGLFNPSRLPCPLVPFPPAV